MRASSEKPRCQHHNIVKVRVHRLTTSLSKSTSDVVHYISHVGEDKNLLLRHRMPLPLTRQATGRGLGSLYGPKKLDDSLLINLLVCAGEVYQLLLGATEVYQGHFGG
jgi:hypothetical protein